MNSFASLARITLTFFISMLLSSVTFSQNVFFGERNLQDQKLALYFDQQGTVYPEYLIADSSLLRCSGNLADWYARHPAQFGEICTNYNCKFPEISPENLAVLQDSIMARIAGKINEKSRQSVTFLIHGYRKSFVDVENGISSVNEFKMLTKKLDSLQLKSDLYVEIYWDATYNCCFSANKKKNDALFRQFEFAQQNAPKIGLSLRKIINLVDAEKINVVGHSLGCKVAVASLFNMVPSEIKTPGNSRVNLCLIAPAIGGRTVFNHYYERQTSVVDFRQKDNYHVYILYNEKDFVLKKKDNKTGVFGPGTLKYGETTLGCNYRNEANRLVEYFAEKFPSSSICLQNMSDLGKKHSLRYYTNLDYLQKAVNFLNE